jgi:hypothetical protein
MPEQSNMTRGISNMETSVPVVGRARRSGVARKVLLCLLAVVLGFGTPALFVKMRKDAVESARCAKCRSELKAISLALLAYKNKHGAFPPAYFCDKSGKPVNSWRLLVADLAFYHRNVSAGYDVSQSWGAPRNFTFGLRNQTVEEFQCPSAGGEGPAITNYVAVVGPNTMWPGCEPAKPADDSSDNDKILVIEVVNSDILWMEPRDLTLEQALDTIQPKTGAGIGSHHSDGIHYVTVGGEVRTLDPNIDRESLRKLLVRASAEAPPK